MAGKERRDNPSGKEGAVLVTGGTGRLGRSVIKEFLRRKSIVRALVSGREAIMKLPSGTIPYVGDIKDEYVIRKACEGVDTVYHLAAIVSQYRASPNEIIRVNTEGTKSVVEASADGGAKHLVFTSSVDVYGRRRSELLNEESELKPEDTYGQSKVLAEHAIREHSGKMAYTIFRMAAIYGPGFERPFFKLFRLIKEGKARIIGDGKNNLCLIHLDDVIQAMMLARESKTSHNKIYNLTDGREYTQEYLFNLAADLLNVKRPRRHVSGLVVKILAKARGLDSDELRFLTSNRHVDITKIRKELGFESSVDIKDSGRYLIEKFLNSGYR